MSPMARSYGRAIVLRADRDALEQRDGPGAICAAVENLGGGLQAHGALEAREPIGRANARGERVRDEVRPALESKL